MTYFFCHLHLNCRYFCYQSYFSFCLLFVISFVAILVIEKHCSNTIHPSSFRNTATRSMGRDVWSEGDARPSEGDSVLLQSPQWCSVLPVLIPQTGYHLISWITKPHWVSPPPHISPSPQADCHDNPTLNPSLWTLMLEVLTRTASRKGPGTLRLRSPLEWGT